MSKKTDKWMPLYIGDYLADTGHLTTTQHGAYLLLIMHYWRKGSLPDDDKQLAAIAKLTLRIWLDIKETIQAFFHDGWQHKRIDEQLERQCEISSKRIAAGAKGGRPRKQEQTNCEANGVANQKQNETKESKAKIVDDADDARAKAPLISDRAKRLADELLVIAGHSLEFVPPGWCGAPMRVETWLAQGWMPEIIVAAVTGAAARKRGQPAHSVQFFENAIAEEVARQSTPLPNVQVRQAETLTVTHGRNEKSGQISAAGSKLVESLKRGFGGTPSESYPSGGAGDTDAGLLAYRGGQ